MKWLNEKHLLLVSIGRYLQINQSGIEVTSFNLNI